MAVADTGSGDLDGGEEVLAWGELEEADALLRDGVLQQQHEVLREDEAQQDQQQAADGGDGDPPRAPLRAPPGLEGAPGHHPSVGGFRAGGGPGLRSRSSSTWSLGEGRGAKV